MVFSLALLQYKYLMRVVTGFLWNMMENSSQERTHVINSQYQVQNSQYSGNLTHNF